MGLKNVCSIESHVYRPLQAMKNHHDSRNQGNCGQDEDAESQQVGKD